MSLKTKRFLSGSLNVAQRTRGSKALVADLAELVLSIAREVSLLTERDGKRVLTATEINVMRYIDRHPGIIPREAARGVSLKLSNFSGLLHSLRDKNMVAIVPDEFDCSDDEHLLGHLVQELSFGERRLATAALRS